VLWWGSRLAEAGEMTRGEVTSFLGQTLRTARALGSLSKLWVEVVEGSQAVERIFLVIDDGHGGEIDAPINSGSRGMLTLPDADVAGEICFEGVRFAYPSRPDTLVLDDFHLTLKAGKTTALVGESGSGKSTVAALLSRFYDPLDGEVKLDGVPIQTLDPRWLRQQIGLVSQEPVLFTKSIRDNIRYADPAASDEKVHDAARRADALGFIEELPDGYDTVLAAGGNGLAVGQKQRVAIARLVLKEPKIFVLDEATSALDVHSEESLLETLGNAARNKTTLVIAHRLSTVRNADKIVVMSQGKVVEEGTHDELMRKENGAYKILAELQSQSEPQQVQRG
jgi:ABC-type multidrug transport system fused ATPase/permease subunit